MPLAAQQSGGEEYMVLSVWAARETGAASDGSNRVTRLNQNYYLNHVI